MVSKTIYIIFYMIRMPCTKLNIVFAVQLIAVVCAVLGVFPREVLLFSSGVLVFFVLFSPMEESVLLMARSIPVFAALPITDTFDSLNIWRVLALILFLKWFFAPGRIRTACNALFFIYARAKESVGEAWRYAWKEWKVETLAALLFFISLLSLYKAEDAALGVKRIIYFANLWMLFFVVRSVARRENIKHIAWNVLCGGSIVLVVGMLQLVSAYIMTVDNFSEFWAFQVHKTLYGNAWANIAIAANTWFAYYNGTIHLRMFSSFPDTHSFPLYLLMALCFALFLLHEEKGKGKTFFLFMYIALSFAGAVLSGTRGIWASALFPLLFLGYLVRKKYPVPRSVFAPFAAFFILLLLSGFIFNAPQFRLLGSESEKSVLVERIKSIMDTGEESNRGRIFIWKETARSIMRHPLFGVGIGNFPVILKLNPTATKAGASAHNLYLHIFAELGIFGFAVFSFIVWEAGKMGWRLFMRNDDAPMRFFGLTFCVYFIWIVWYSMTDFAIFDERAFLMLMILLGAVFALASHESKNQRINETKNQ